MGKLTYAAITSLDGYIEDEDGRLDWAVPDPEVHAFVNDLERPIRTYLYGRRMYETMAVWQTVGDEPAGTSPGEVGASAEVGASPGDGAPAPEELAYAEVWRAADKVVYSRTLDAVWTPRTRLEPAFDPAAVRSMKDAADHELSVSGRAWRGTRSRPGSSTRSTCSCSRSSSGVASPGCPRASGWTWSCSASAGSATVPSTCTTGPRDGVPRRVP